MSEKPTLLSVLQRLVGQEYTYTDEFEVEKGMLQRFAIAVGDPNPIYHDEEFARATPYGGVIAPPTFLFEWNHHKHNLLSSERRTSIFSSLERQPRLLRGVNEYEIGQPLRPGDIIKSQSRITEVYEKQGRSGKLVFAICETTYFNQKQQLLGRARDTFIFLA